MVNGVVGLRLRIDRLEGAWKLLQRKPEPDRIGAIDGLATESDGGRAVADHMRALLEPVV